MKAKRKRNDFEVVGNLLQSDPLLAGKFEVETVALQENGRYTVTIARGGDTTISFETLDAISRVFATKKIDVDSVNRVTGYCETCADSETISQVTIFEAVL